MLGVARAFNIREGHAGQQTAMLGVSWEQIYGVIRKRREGLQVSVPETGTGRRQEPAAAKELLL